MTLYELQIGKKTLKFLARLPEKHFLQIQRRILELAQNPRPHDSEQMRGSRYFRLDQGEYRVVYDIQKEVLVILIIKVGKRNDGEVYR